ncbi:hypothetical protein [Ferrimicrobium sp.]
MLFVEPDCIGTGVGRLLWKHMVGQAPLLGFRSVRIEAIFSIPSHLNRRNAIAVHRFDG